jgi:O-antigen ligase
MNSGLRNKLVFFGAVLFLLDAFAIPDLRLYDQLPAFQLTDFLWPLGVPLILPHLRKLGANRWFIWLGGFAIYVMVPIVVNGRLGEMNDWFEIYKILKLGGLFILFSYASKQDFTPFIRASFIGLVAINLMHFFDVLNFNHWMQEVYGSSIHWEFFGKDSEGNPAVKRMLGTIGNPNSNALLFLFFAAFFIPQANTWKAKAWFFGALLMMFMCQSRTSLLACGAMIIYLLFVHFKQGNRYFVWQIPLLTAVVYCIGLMLSTSFFQYNGYSDSLLDGSAMHSNSLRSRWETWGILWEMIQAKPLFGYGPFKSYFVEHRLYSENEYLLMWWRYGLFGLLFYLGILLIPIKSLFGKIQSINQQRMILFSWVMLIAALTNNPLTERSVGILFVFLVALGSQEWNTHEKTAPDRQ